MEPETLHVVLRVKGAKFIRYARKDYVRGLLTKWMGGRRGLFWALLRSPGCWLFFVNVILPKMSVYVHSRVSV